MQIYFLASNVTAFRREKGKTLQQIHAYDDRKEMITEKMTESKKKRNEALVTI